MIIFSNKLLKKLIQYVIMSRSSHSKILIEFIKKNDEKEALDYLKCNKISNSYRDRNGRSVLLWACTRGLPDLALQLIDKSTELSHKPDSENNTPLIWACCNCVSEEFKKAKKSDYKRDDGSKMNKDMTKVVIKLIELGDSCIPEIQNVHNNTALLWLCYKSLDNLAAYMVDILGESIEPFVPSKYEIAKNIRSGVCKKVSKMRPKFAREMYHCLLLACDKRMEKTSLKILEKFGDRCKPWYCKCVPLCIGIKYEGAHMTPLLLACKSGLDKVVVELLKYKTKYKELGFLYEDGDVFKQRYPLYYLCTNNKPNLALQLLKTFDSNRKFFYGLCECIHICIIKVGTEVRTKESKNKHRDDYLILSRYLIGVLPLDETLFSEYGKNKDSFLGLTCKYDIIDLAMLLMNKLNIRSGINKANKNGETPLKIAIQRGHHKLVTRMLEIIKEDIRDTYLKGVNEVSINLEFIHDTIIDTTTVNSTEKLYPNL